MDIYGEKMRLRVSHVFSFTKHYVRKTKQNKTKHDVGRVRNKYLLESFQQNQSNDEYYTSGVGVCAKTTKFWWTKYYGQRDVTLSI